METYEEKYKDLVKRLNKAREEKGVYTFNSVLDAVAPELAVSEDERIIERILFSLQKDIMATKNSGCSTKDLEKCIAWLEKQGEQKDKLEDAVLDSNKDGLIADTIRYKREKQCEQKPAWSEEDREYMKSLLDIINGTPSLTPSEVKCHKDWLKSLKDRLQPQTNAEWSEEDEENFARVDYACLKTYGGDSYSSDWLRKFLGIHKKWKPSDEQLKALKEAVDEHFDIDGGALWHLYEDLKKLKD